MLQSFSLYGVKVAHVCLKEAAYVQRFVNKLFL